jgi:hypothetical protein
VRPDKLVLTVDHLYTLLLQNFFLQSFINCIHCVIQFYNTSAVPLNQLQYPHMRGQAPPLDLGSNYMNGRCSSEKFESIIKNTTILSDLLQQTMLGAYVFVPPVRRVQLVKCVSSNGPNQRTCKTCTASPLPRFYGKQSVHKSLSYCWAERVLFKITLQPRA